MCLRSNPKPKHLIKPIYHDDKFTNVQYERGWKQTQIFDSPIEPKITANAQLTFNKHNAAAFALVNTNKNVIHKSLHAKEKT